jgi:hypothetical protein
VKKLSRACSPLLPTSIAFELARDHAGGGLRDHLFQRSLVNGFVAALAP